MSGMECPRCYFDEQGEASGGSRPCGACGRSYRPAVNVYLGVVSLIYLVFVRYISYILTGEFFKLGTWPPQTVFDWAQWPINVQYRPEWHLILGAFLALLVLVPVVMGLLYGKRGGYLLAFIALVAGPSWVVALMLFFCVWLAGGWTLRLHNKVASVIIGCMPVWIYYLVTSRPTTEVTLPGAYFVPAVLSIVFSLLLIALIIAPLRSLRWNTRVVGIALVVLLASPVVSYKMFVGEDSMQYAFLARDYGMDGDTFRDSHNSQIIQDLLATAEKQVDEKLSKLAAEQADFGTEPDMTTPQERQQMVEGELGVLKIDFVIGFRAEMDRRRRAVIEQSEAFLARYPDSRHVPDVLYTIAQAQDMEIDTSALSEARAVALPIRFDPSRAVAETETIWQRLLKEFGQTKYAATAMVKLADLQARRGDFAEAVGMYNAMIERFGDEIRQPLPDTSSLSVFTDLLSVGQRLKQARRVRHLEDQYRLAQAHRALLLANSDCPACGGELLKKYLGLGRYQPPHERQALLGKLMVECPTDPLVDNLAYEIALLQPNDRLRMEALEQAVQQYAGTDGAALSLYEMARLDSAAEDASARRLERALRHYYDLRQQYPTFYLAPMVDKQIAVLEHAVRRASSGAANEFRGGL